MFELMTGFVLTLISLLVGYNLGKHQQVVPPDTQKQIARIFQKVVPNDEVGAVMRPTAQDNYYRDNPQIAREDELMASEFDNLNKNG